MKPPADDLAAGDAVILKGTRIRATVKSVYGAGTAGDPRCATITIPAQTIPVRLVRLTGRA